MLSGRQALVAATTILLLGGCDFNIPTLVEDPRACDPNTGNSNWVTFGFDADVTTPAVCPIQLDSVGQRQDFEGVVFAPASLVAISAHGIIEIRNAVTQHLNTVDLTYFFDFIRDEQRANFTDFYLAGTVPANGLQQRDLAEFQTNFNPASGGGSKEALGSVDLTYTQVPGLTMSGPATASTSSFVQVSVSVTNGKPPLSYQWYHNDAPVGSNTSGYTTWDLSQGTHRFDVIVTDAEGDANNASHTVQVQ